MATAQARPIRRVAPEVAVTVREMVLDHDGRIGDLEEWRSEVRGAMTLLRVTLGTSIIGTVVAVVALLRPMP